MAPTRPLGFDPIAEARRQWEAHGWDVAADGMAAVTSIMRVQQIFLSRVEACLRELELTFARYEVLVLLTFSRKGSLPLGKVGERLQVHPASVTNAIDRLEAQGLVRRRANALDRRGTLAQITPSGRRVAARATEKVNELVFASIGLSGEEQKLLFELLRKIRLDEGDFVETT